MPFPIRECCINMGKARIGYAKEIINPPFGVHRYAVIIMNVMPNESMIIYMQE